MNPLQWIGGFTTRFWQIALVVALCLVPIAYLWGRGDGKAAERARWTAAQMKALETARKADAKAADKRAADTLTNTEADTARKEAIANAADDETGAASAALACERLSRAGKHTAATRERCAGNGGGQARSQP